MKTAERGLKIMPYEDRPGEKPKRTRFLILLRGPSGCGKTTHARNLLKADGRLMRVNRDELRAMSFARWTDVKENYIRALERAAAVAAADQGYNLLVDDTNLTLGAAAHWEHIAETLEFRFRVLDVYQQTPGASLEMCIERDAQRGSKRVGRSVLERQFLLGQYVDWGHIPVVFVDLDGTLADLSHREHFIHCTLCHGTGSYSYSLTGDYLGEDIPCQFCNATGSPHEECPSCGSPTDVDRYCETCDGSGRVRSKKDHRQFFSLCGEDTVIEVVARWVRELHKTHTVCIVSGRPMDLAGDLSIEWLRRHEIPFDHIYLRRDKDMRPDTIVKQELLEEILASGLPKTQIAFVIDDRLQVVEMWRHSGLRVIPVGSRDYVFE